MPDVLVAGASGVVGRAAATEFVANGWTVTGLSRRDPGVPGCEHLALDLQDDQAARQALAGRSFSHVVYAALYEQPGLVAGWREQEQMDTNLTMLRNCLEPLLNRGGSSKLRHVSLLQGTKAYGAHVHPMRVPGREHLPRDDHANFYWLHEDWLCQQQQMSVGTAAEWAFTIWRPPLIIGHASGAPMNVLAPIGAYAALCRELGQPLAFPGGACGVLDAVDSRLLARALHWAVAVAEPDHPERSAAAVRATAANETFNVSNGDVFVWPTLWPAIAGAMGLAAGPAQPRQLQHWLREHADLWDQIRARDDLTAPGLLAFTGDSDIYADLLMNSGQSQPPPPTLLSTIKLRQAGFNECMDTEASVVDWLTRMRQARLFP